MNIAHVFAANLRRLTDQVGNISEVARLLDINRAQYNRYLNSEAYPKPAILDRICTFYNVDARILTQPLKIDEIQDLPQPALNNAPVEINRYWEHAARWLPGNKTSAPSPDEIADGLYLFWRPSMSILGHYVSTPVLIGTYRTVRTIKMYGVRSEFLMSHSNLPNEREYRGTIMRQNQGFVAFLFPCVPTALMAMIYLSNESGVHTQFTPGYLSLPRNASNKFKRTAPCLFQKLPSHPRSILTAARNHRYFTREELPRGIFRALNEAGDTHSL